MNGKIKDFIKTQFEKLRELPTRERNKEIIANVKKKFNEVISSDDIYELCVRIEKMKEKIQKINDEIDDSKPYEVVDGHYVFHRKDEAPFRFSIEEIDDMFLDFSSKGNNLTWEEMLQKYELKPEAWQCIKHRLRLYKASNVISPFTAENTPEEELDKKIEYAISRHIDSIKGKMVQTYDKQFKVEAKKAFKILWNLEYFLEHLQTYLESYQPVKFDFVPKQIYNNDIKHFVITDIHLGKTNTKDIIARIDRVHDEILRSPERIIYLTCLGDMVETLAQDGMHPWQIAYGMDSELWYGFELMMNTVKIFEKLLISLYKNWKEVIFNGITGNHGRMTGRKEDDIMRTWELVIFELIKRGLQNMDIQLNYHKELINTFSYWNLNFIIAHGDNKFAERKQTDVLWKHWNNRKYNVIMLWDRHNVKVQEEKNWTWIQCPALAGQWHYDKSMDLHSEAWYIVMKENDIWTVDITIKRLR